MMMLTEFFNKKSCRHIYNNLVTMLIFKLERKSTVLDKRNISLRHEYLIFQIIFFF